MPPAMRCVIVIGEGPADRRVIHCRGRHCLGSVKSEEKEYMRWPSSTARGRLAAVFMAMACGLAGASSAQAEEGAPGDSRLKGVPANTWVRLGEEPSGGRDMPILYYAPALGRFVLSGGAPVGKAHFDTEEFDLAAGTWANAYPEGAPYKNATGPTDAPSLGERVFRGSALTADANGVMRLRRTSNPWESEGRAHHQWAFNRDDGRLYAYLYDTTVAYNPADRQWTDLKAAKFNTISTGPLNLQYGSLAYDSVNKEILSVGGTSDEDGGTPGTWAFPIAAGEWRKVPVGSPQQNALRAEVEALRRRTDAFVNACRNRFYVTETEAEAKADLSKRAAALAAAVDALVARLTAGTVEMGATVKPWLRGAAVGLKAVAGTLAGAVTSDALLAAQSAADVLLRACRALDAEPCGRAWSQMAADPVNGTVVLFGGSRQDSYLADTWVYECKTRTWEQRYPKVCPSPRAAHALVWLPKSGRVVLFGGHSRTATKDLQVHRDLWTYDVQANEWKLLAQFTDGPVNGPAAADPNDVLLVVGQDPRHRDRRLTWAMKVDPSAAAKRALLWGPDAGSAQAGVAPGTIAAAFTTPSDYDRVTKPDPEGIAKVLTDLPANRWTRLPKPPRDTNQHPWGTAPYDSKRHQILYWGGGHSRWVWTDLGHYSLRTATWSTGYADEYPPTFLGFRATTNLTFNNRPHMPTHVWGATAYDPVADKAVYCVRGTTWTYDPATRAWDYPPGPPIGGELWASMCSTPKGVVHWGKGGTLHLFDAKARTWTPLPITGGTIGDAYGDETGMTYDSKRNGLWLSRNGSPVMRYDLETGALTTIPTARPEKVWMRETAYIPELDMLLNVGRVQGPDGQVGNLAYDIENSKWVGLELPMSDNKPHLYDNGYWPVSLVLHYDTTLKVAVFLLTTQEVFVTTFDKASAKAFEVTLHAAKPPRK